jgi:hypothetical protein
METVTRLCKRVLKVVREYFSKLKTIDELNKFQIHINNTVTTGERIFVGGFQIGYDKGDYELEQGQASNSNSDNNYIENKTYSTKAITTVCLAGSTLGGSLDTRGLRHSSTDS